MVIGTIFYAVLASWGGALVLALSAKDMVWDSRSFPAFLWIPALLVATGAAALAFVVGAARPAAHHAFFARQPFRIYLLALAIPLVCLLLPRFLFGVVFQPYLEPSRWPQLFIPHPLPTILVVYIIAFLEEFAIRGYPPEYVGKVFITEASYLRERNSVAAALRIRHDVFAASYGR